MATALDIEPGELNGHELGGARWYDPTVGRWLSEDPSGLVVDADPYRYVDNDPANATDPTGLRRYKMNLTIAFVEDAITEIAEVANSFDSEITIKVTDKKPDWDAIRKELNDKFDNNDLVQMKDADVGIVDVSIAGHGSPGEVGPIRAETLDDPKVRTLLAELRQLLYTDNTGAIKATIHIKTCNFAKSKEGQEMMKKLAKLTGADVTAIDDIYAVFPSGTEYTAHPDGTMGTPVKHWKSVFSTGINGAKNEGVTTGPGLGNFDPTGP